jgi:hypothetical protein
MGGEFARMQQVSMRTLKALLRSNLGHDLEMAHPCRAVFTRFSATMDMIVVPGVVLIFFSAKGSEPS